MPATLREVLKTNTFEQQRQIINTLAQDVFDISSLGSTVSLLDGSLSDPSLFFSTNDKLGLYKSNTNEFSAVSDDVLVFRFSSTANISSVPFIANSATINTAVIDNLTANNLSFTATSEFYTNLFTGTILDGRGYDVGVYENIPLTGGTGNNALATITVSPGGVSSASVTNAGSGLVQGSYSNVEFDGGTGSGFIADVEISPGGSVSNVTIKNRGINYEAGDILTLPDNFSSSSFAYTVNSVANIVTDVEVTNAGDGNYLVNDIVSAEDSSFGTGSYTDLQFRITGFTKNAEFLYDEAKVRFNYDINVRKDSLLAYGNNSSVFIGYENKIDRTSNLVEKLEVNGNARFQGNIKSNESIVASLGSVRNPSIKFDLDPSSTVWNRTGFFGDVSDGSATLNVVADTGRVARFFSTKTELYKDTKLVNVTFGDPVIQKGSGYELGSYPAVEVSGGSGSGLLLDLTVSFDGDLIEPGAGYTDGSYTDIPVSYYTLPGGSVQTVVNLVGGSNYVNGSYFNVPLEDGTGNFATADIVITGGSISSVTIVSGGTGYSVNDTLTVNTQNVGGSKLNSVTITNGGSNYANGTYLNVPLTNTGSQGSGATIDLIVSGNTITSATINQPGAGYIVGDTFSINTNELDSNDNYSFNVTDTTGTSYTFTGDATGENPTITVNKSDNLSFNIDVTPPGAGGAGGNTFYIVSGLSPSGGFDSQQVVTSGINNNGISFGTITWTPTTAGTYYYISNTDSNLKGEIVVIETASGSGLSLTAATLTTGSGFSIDVATVGTSTGGTGALANIEISGGEVQSIVITDGGSGYQIFDELTVVYTDLQFIDPLGQTIQSVEPSTDFVFRITTVGAISVTEVNDPGSGYEEGDIVTLPSSFRTGLTIVEWQSGFQVYSGEYVRFDYRLYQVTTSGKLGIIGPTHTIGSQSNGDSVLAYFNQEYYYEFGSGTGEATIELEKITGLVKSKNLELTDDSGININNKLSITSSTLSKSTTGNLIITANDFVQIGGSKALIIPSGTTAQRPGNASFGAIRYNTTDNRFEGYDGQYFVSLGGVRDVDGNTYITAELNPGDDDNVLRFVNDGTQTLQIEKDKVTLQKVNTLHVTDITGVTQWEAGQSVTASTDPEITFFLYHEENVYSIDTSGELDLITPPSHTSGTVTNGSVDLTYVRSIYGDLNLKLNNLNLSANKLNVNNGAVNLFGDLNTAKIGSSSTNLDFVLTNSEDTFIRLSETGQLSINNGFGLTPNYIQVLDYNLNNFNLKDTRIYSTSGLIDTNLGNATNLIIVPYNVINSSLEAYSGKIMVEIIDDSVVPRRQYTELSFLVKSDLSDTLYTENNKIYTDIELCDISVGIDGSNNISVDVIDLTNSSTTVYTIKVISQLILV